MVYLVKENRRSGEKFGINKILLGRVCDSVKTPPMQTEAKLEESQRVQSPHTLVK